MLDTFRVVSPGVEFWMGNSFRTGLNTEHLITDSLMPVQQKLSAQWGLPYFDLWTPSHVNGFHLNPDSTHPDSAGYAILAQHLYQIWNTPKPVLTLSGNTITAPAGYAAYWWYKDSVLISPANGSASNIWPQAGYGQYKVLVRLNNQNLDRLASEELRVVTGVNSARAVAKFKLYPNPVSDVVNIEFNSPAKASCTLEVFDALGRKVLYENSLVHEGANGIVLNVGKLNTGLYSIRFAGKGKTMEMRFVKQ